jgi:hypothetical protein
MGFWNTIREGASGAGQAIWDITTIPLRAINQNVQEIGTSISGYSSYQSGYYSGINQSAYSEGVQDGTNTEQAIDRQPIKPIDFSMFGNLGETVEGTTSNIKWIAVAGLGIVALVMLKR